jgi:ATP-dependent 26S proteasome regulatory subunit
MATKFEMMLNKLIRARSGLIWARTNEERRAETLIKGVAQKIGFKKVLIWKTSTGLTNPADPTEDQQDLAVLCKSSFAPPSAQPDGVMEYLLNFQGGGPVLVIMEDLSPHISENAPNRVQALRLLKDLGRKAQSSRLTDWVQVVVLDAGKPNDMFIPIELELPSRDDLRSVVSGATRVLKDERKQQVEDMLSDNGNMDNILDALIGLEDLQAQQALAVSLAEKGTIDPQVLIESKKALISSPAVKWIDPNPRGLEAIGGLELLKGDLMIMRQTFTDAQKYDDTPRPKGIVIAGVPGTGKSLSAKCVGTAWNLPTVQLSVGAMMGKYIGDSEGGWYKARDVVEAIAPCIMWIDEIEKAFSGFSGSGDSDGGTSRRLGQEILTWLNDCDKPVFIVATSNDPMKLDAEFLRAGRFDETYWVDVPNTEDRVKILDVVSSKYRCIATNKLVAHMGLDWTDVAKQTKDFSGAELEQAVKNAIMRTNYRREEITAESVISESKLIRPVVRGWGEGKLATQRKWGEGARQACAPENDIRKEAEGDFDREVLLD